MEWPAHSLDLNAIEKVWAQCKRIIHQSEGTLTNLHEGKYSQINQLREFATKSLKSIDQNFYSKIVAQKLGVVDFQLKSRGGLVVD